MIEVTHGLVKGGHWTGSTVFYLKLANFDNVEAEAELKTLNKTLEAFHSTQPIGIYVRSTDWMWENDLDVVITHLRKSYPNVQIIVEVDNDKPIGSWADVANWVIYKGTVSDVIPAGVNEAQLGWAVGDGPINHLRRTLWGSVLLYVYPLERSTMNDLFTWMNKQTIPVKLIPYGLAS